MVTFVPWVIFWIVAGPRTWEVASGCALLSSVMLLVIGLDTSSAGRRTPKILDLGTAAFFLVLVIVGLFVDRHALIGWRSTRRRSPAPRWV
jgi:hypothetical protein